MSETEMTGLVARLEALEKRVRWWRNAAIAAPLWLLGVLVMTGAGKSSEKFDTITAQRIEIVDKSGMMLMEVGASAVPGMGHGIFMVDPDKHHLRGLFAVKPPHNIPILQLMGEGLPDVTLNSTPGGGFLEFNSVARGGEQAATRVAIGVNKENDGVLDLISDGKGIRTISTDLKKVIWQSPLDQSAPAKAPRAKSPRE